MTVERGGRKRSKSGKRDKGRERLTLELRLKAFAPLDTKPGYHKPGSLQSGRCR